MSIDHMKSELAKVGLSIDDERFLSELLSEHPEAVKVGFERFLPYARCEWLDFLDQRVEKWRTLSIRFQRVGNTLHLSKTHS